MTTKAGVGYSINPDSKKAGYEAANAAMKEAGAEKCDLALIFSSSQQEPKKLRDGVREVIGSEAKLTGGTSMGIITRNYLGYDSFQVGVLIIQSDTVHIDMFIEKGLENQEKKVGFALGDQIKNKKYAGEQNLFLMYDSIKSSDNPSFPLNMATPLLEGIKESIKIWPRTAGVGMFSNMQLSQNFMFFDDNIIQDAAIALILSGNLQMDSIIMHGCKPASNYYTITKAEGNIVFEIEGKPALEMITGLLGPDSDMDWDHFPMWLTLGVNKGDKYEEFKEENYANRLCVAVDKERKALVMFENDLRTGDKVQLMRRSIEMEYVGKRSEVLLEQIKHRKPVFALYIDCAGRAAGYCDAETEEAEGVKNIIGSKMPLLGIYSGVEIARFRDDMQALDWTGVLCIFSE